MTIAVYAITNKATGRKYIGASIEVENRWKAHIKCLNSERGHSNKDLLHDWHKYGQSGFSFEVIEKVSPEELRTREKFWLAQYPDGYEASRLRARYIKENGHKRVLNDQQVREVRKLKGFRKVCDLADEFGVSHSLISLIHSGDRYGDVV